MIRIDARTVELTLEEIALQDRFNAALEDGLGIQDAAWRVLSALTPMQRLPFDNAFYLYLSDGTVGYSVLTGEFYRRYPNTMPVIMRPELQIIEIEPGPSTPLGGVA